MSTPARKQRTAATLRALARDWWNVGNDFRRALGLKPRPRTDLRKKKRAR